MKAILPAAVVLALLGGALYPQISQGTGSACTALDRAYGDPARGIAKSAYPRLPADAGCWLAYWRLKIGMTLPADRQVTGGDGNPPSIALPPQPPAPTPEANPPDAAAPPGPQAEGPPPIPQPRPPDFAPGAGPEPAPRGLPRQAEGPPPPPPFYPASFNCARARSSVEQTICADRNLAALDVQMAGMYQRAMNSVVDRNALRGEQLDWLALRRDACVNVPCLRTVYNQRIAELRHWMGP